MTIDMQIFIVLCFIQWTYCSITEVDKKKEEKEFPYLVIEPISSRLEYGSYVIKKVQDTLNLTCTVFDNSTDMEPRYNITWLTPASLMNSKNHVVTQPVSANSLNLIVSHLETKDEGDYTCRAQPLDRDQQPLLSVVKVNIKNRKCGETMFSCALSKIQFCIPRRFKCDGHQDCQMGEDEDQEVCGESPCSNKLQCEDPNSSVVRCIPKSWCCNVRVDPNCTIREPLSCCPLSYHKSFMDERSYYPSQPHYTTDMTFLQTTIYTVIGCAMVFMIVVTVLVIAICRVHMKRSLMSQCPTNLPPASQLPQSTPLYDLDMYLNRGCSVDNLPPPGFLVTYNINNGVQIVGHAIDPPPYCEVISVPPREGPPPPYTSREARDLPETEALLQQPSISQGSKTESQQERRTAEECQGSTSESEAMKLCITDPSSDTANLS